MSSPNYAISSFFNDCSRAHLLIKSNNDTAIPPANSYGIILSGPTLLIMYCSLMAIPLSSGRMFGLQMLWPLRLWMTRPSYIQYYYYQLIIIIAQYYITISKYYLSSQDLVTWVWHPVPIRWRWGLHLHIPLLLIQIILNNYPAFEFGQGWDYPLYKHIADHKASQNRHTHQPIQHVEVDVLLYCVLPKQFSQDQLLEVYELIMFMLFILDWRQHGQVSNHVKV